MSATMWSSSHRRGGRRWAVGAIALAFLGVCAVEAQEFFGPQTEDPLERTEDETASPLIEAIRSEAVVLELRLTNGQREKVEQVLAEFDSGRQAVEESLAEQLEGVESLGERLRQRADFQSEKRKKLEALARKAEEELLSILSDVQKDRLRQRARTEANEQTGSSGPPAGAASAPESPHGPGDGESESGSEPYAAGESARASFEATPPKDPGNRQAADSDAPGASLLSFSFHQAPWTDVLKLFAEKAGLTLNLRDTPPGTFTYYDERTYTPAEALDVMNRYLLQDGYILVRHDRFLTVFEADQGVPPNLVESVAPEQLSSRGETELVRVVFQLDDSRDAEQTAEELEPLIGPHGRIAPLPSSNSVVVTDVVSNQKRIQDLVGPPPKLEVTMKSFTLENIAAQEAAAIIKNLFPLETQAQNAALQAARGSRSRGRSRREWFRRRFGRGRDDDDDENRAPQPSGPSNPVAVAVDVRTNTILVRARHADMKVVEDAVKAIDVPYDGTSLASTFGRAPDEPYFEVYQLQSADVDDVERTLRDIYPTAIINEDDDTDRLHIYATEAQHQQIAVQVRQIDGALGSNSLAVIPVGALDPYQAAATVDSLFFSDGSPPSVQVGPYGENVIVRGSSGQVAQIRNLLDQYGAGQTGGAGRSGPVRRIRVGNPDEVARLLRRLWSASNPNPIRVVPSGRNREEQERARPARPEQPEPDQSDAAPGGEEPDEDLRTEVEFTPATGRPPNRLPARLVSQVDGRDRSAEGRAEDAGGTETDETGEDTGSPAEGTNGSDSGGAPPVIVSVEDGELVIASEDEEALDRLEALVGRLARSMPSRTEWTVFYLRRAGAAETATMLSQLLPAGTVGSPLGGGLTAAGRPGLHIVPEERMNALFVSGPPQQVRDVERLLKVLDSDELPESLRDRVPRTIPVRYANVNEVAGIVRDVYGDYMAQARRGRRDGNRSGGGEDGGKSGPAGAGARLSLGVDTRTSQLIVSASGPLFEEIEALVEELDEAAREAERIVRVVPSENGAVVAQTLDALFPQVTVSTTASPAGPSRDRSAGSAGPRREGRRGRSDDESERAERIRRFLERRERFRRGGDDDSDGSRGRSGRRGRRGFGRDRD